MLSYYSPRAVWVYVYMLQTVEYDAGKFMRWLTRRPNLNKVQRRGELVKTRKAQALIGLGSVIDLLLDLLGIWLLFSGNYLVGIVVLVLAPWQTAILLALGVWLGNGALLIYRRPLLGQARRQLADHQAIKIAVLGSYGKTTMKELLLTILGQARHVQATPGNMNVPISHARWITSRVEDDAEILIFEYGEGEPGDIERFAKLTQPQYAVVTGMAPNHLDKYANLDELAADLASIAKHVESEKIYVHDDNSGLTKHIPGAKLYDESSVAGWKIQDITIDYDGTEFSMTKGSKKIALHSPLLGRHQVGPLTAVAALAHDLGLTDEEITRGVAETKTFEHRMQPRQLHGAWIIDDTYNGNLEGIRAGLQLLQDLKAKRKIYVTPGLVDQGKETERVHQEIGRLIAAAKPDQVVLMDNSVRPIIEKSLKESGYEGELAIETNPLEFYTNIEHTVAAGDLVVMQNDWTDNYY